jgi:hypothetical protein
MYNKMGNKYSCSNENIKDSILKINNWLIKCANPYTVQCHFCEDDKTSEMIYENITIPSKCHDTKLNDCSIVYVLAMYKGKVASYLAFKIYKEPLPFIEMAWGCTGADSRRKSLSTILRMVPVILALDVGIPLIVSDANDMSGPLLRNKFGFVFNEGDDGDGEYSEEYGNLIEWQVSPSAYLDMRDKNVKERTIDKINSMINSCSKN